MHNPIKRNISLKNVSRDHHHGLQLSLKVRKGLKKGVAAERMKRYTEWFWTSHLLSHFNFEEKYMFPILGMDNELILRALEEHKRLQQLFTASDLTELNLLSMANELREHIRFEERVLFNEIEKNASNKELNLIEQGHSTDEFMEWHDQFWVAD